MKNCDQFRDLIEAYALGALDLEDRAAIEAHLATGCLDCSKAVEEARWLVSQLACTTPEAAPSDMLKGRLMQTVRAEAQNEAQAHPQAKPHALPTKSAIPFWLWAGVAALLIFSIYSAWNIRRLQIEIQEANNRAGALQKERQEIEKQLALTKRESMILMDPTSVKIMMPGSNKQGPQLEAKWHSQLGIVVMGDKIPMPAPNHVLQLWFIPKDSKAKPTPSMMTWPDANGKFVMLVSNPPQSMDDTKALAVTEEPAGGSEWPTTTPRWVGGVS